jgi:hypothetical protein
MKVVGARRAGVEPLRIGFAAPEACVKAEETQDAEMVFGNPGERIADEPDPPGNEVLPAAEIVVNGAGFGLCVERVDGEIAPGRILAPAVGECDGARRPSVEMSRRRVVTSTGLPADTAVTVPCAMPVGTALMPAARRRSTTSPGSSRVARSTSLTGRSSRVSRTAPPTKRVISPPPSVLISSAMPGRLRHSARGIFTKRTRACG